MVTDRHIDFRLPLLTGVLYGLSWPLFEGLNLSFLAWFAFVPLFIFIERNQHRFWKSISGSLLAMTVFSIISAGWLFNFPTDKGKLAVIFFSSQLWFCVPFPVFYLLNRKIGFDRTLWLFPIFWMLWEWVYLPLEFTMGTHLSPYSQSSNLWLIQFIDLTGMWGVSFWLMLFNVLLFKAYKVANYQWKAALFSRITLFTTILMLGIPLLYTAIAFSWYSQPASKKSLRVSVIPTQFSPAFITNPENHVAMIEQTLYRTDSMAYHQEQRELHSDLYLWPETGLSFEIDDLNLSSLFAETVTDWQAALLTGGKGYIPSADTTDYRYTVSGILLSHTNPEPQFHFKTVLTPGQEAIPYHRWLAKLPFFPIPETDSRFYRKGEESVPLPLTTKKGETFQVGVSICFEQWYPQHWVSLARNHAEVIMHLAAEGWYGEVGFQQFMANVTRMRCIEIRRAAARSANGGLSLFIDQLGNYRLAAGSTLQPASATLYASDTLTLYARAPDWLPACGLLAFLITLGYFLKTNQ